MSVMSFFIFNNKLLSYFMREAVFKEVRVFFLFTVLQNIS